MTSGLLHRVRGLLTEEKRLQRLQPSLWLASASILCPSSAPSRCDVYSVVSNFEMKLSRVGPIFYKVLEEGVRLSASRSRPDATTVAACRVQLTTSSHQAAGSRVYQRYGKVFGGRSFVSSSRRGRVEVTTSRGLPRLTAATPELLTAANVSPLLCCLPPPPFPAPGTPKCAHDTSLQVASAPLLSAPTH